MTKVIDVESFSLDAGELDIAGAAGADGWGTDWTNLGPTLENNVFRIRQSKWRPQLNNVMGAVKGTERIIEEIAELECSLPELTVANYLRAVPGATSTVASVAEVGVGGGTTTLAAAANAGDETISVAATTNLAIGDYVRIEAVGPTAEYRQIKAIAGTVLTLDRPLLRDHASGVSVTETVGDGRTTITGSGRRVENAAYHIYRLRIATPDGLHEYYVRDAINIADTAELVGQREGQAAPRITLQTRYDNANTSVRPWKVLTP